MQFKLRFPLCTLLLITVCCCLKAAGQWEGCESVFLPNQLLRTAASPAVVAASKSKPDVMTASVATAVIDPAVCCGPNSALVDRVELANGRSLTVLGEKLRGKHYLDTALSIVVTDQYWPVASVRAEDIISSLMAQHPLLMVWSGHLYVVDGVIFDESRSCNSHMYVIKKLLLVDTRFSDRRRYVSFDRQTDDWGKVTELLALAITR